MTRKILASDHLSTAAQSQMIHFFPETIQEIESTIAKNEWVIVGMAQNPFVGKARKLLAEKKIEFVYLEYGSYFGKWKQRLAIKLWSGWPTFPQVFHRGQLLGGYKETSESEFLRVSPKVN
jgi:monothiol glutaredoxin